MATPPCRRKIFPGWSNARGEFSNSPAATGLRYFMRRNLRDNLRQEIRAQFEKIRARGWC